jgi:hypothetical protein
VTPLAVACWPLGDGAGLGGSGCGLAAGAACECGSCSGRTGTAAPGSGGTVSANPGTMAISRGAIAVPADPAAAPRAPADAGGWPLLPRLRLITTRAATMISAAHSATSISSSSSMVSPPGERSHVVPYPAGPSRYDLGRDPARAARWQPHATHPTRSARQGLRLPLRERLSVRHHQVPKWVGYARWSGLTALIPGLAGASLSASAGFRYGSRSWGWQCDRVCRKGVREAGEPGRSASRRAGCRS